MTSDIEMIRPRNRSAWLAARGQDVTASQIGALFGEHEFLTTFEIWATKTGRLARSSEETPAMQRGRLLEPVAVQLLRERFPKWKVEHNAAANIYFRDPAARLGGTPDVIVNAPDRGRGVIQIKSVEASVFRHKWHDADVDEPQPPLWIALQATLEAYLTSSSWAAVAPLVIGHGLEMPLIDIPLVPGVVEAMKVKAAEFWRLVAAGEEPPVDYRRDGEVLDRIYAQGDEATEVDLSADNRIPTLVAERAFYRDAIATANRQVEAIDTEIKSKMRDAQVAHIPGGQKITWKPQKRAGFFVEPKTIRALRYPNEKAR
ncbi:YqaJ viral recombinase family protein [Kaistia sp. MMO-174]|uniref:YqaJ viral recombinase family protein n=1 Tax=Kaistia sp. MMO-174 TaxID=3081256 RepID=UPI0030190872